MICGQIQLVTPNLLPVLAPATDFPTVPLATRLRSTIQTVERRCATCNQHGLVTSDHSHFVPLCAIHLANSLIIPCHCYVFPLSISPFAAARTFPFTPLLVPSTVITEAVLILELLSFIAIPAQVVLAMQEVPLFQ